ncbi:protein of unknown function [Methylocella tundrae]|uniref:Uncharacterized protein n=1 Tax=Methylocella tundrae TaxID=227605 RepID=A0A4U8YV37_METTU|nr:protein of unknown function [Methylocella tundrae]
MPRRNKRACSQMSGSRLGSRPIVSAGFRKGLAKPCRGLRTPAPALRDLAGALTFSAPARLVVKEARGRSPFKYKDPDVERRIA